MYNPAHFAVSDVRDVHGFIAANSFATVAGTIGGALHFAYAPVVLDVEPAPFGCVRFHLAKANPLAAVPDGTELKLSFLGAHCYVSPDWYENADQVPTWNYTAAEGSGKVRCLNDAGLRKLLSDLTAQEEKILAPKPPWTMGRLSAGRLEQMLPAIIGFELVFETLDGKHKLSQNRARVDALGVIAALEARGDGTSRAVAAAMRKIPR
jgi:transcriptional regulator